MNVFAGGDAQVPLIKESAAQYKLYCSGRRHCKSLQAIIKLRERQDIFNSVLGLVFPSEDKVEIDVYMKEGSMPQTVIAVATKKIMRIMLQEETGEDGMNFISLLNYSSSMVMTHTFQSIAGLKSCI